MNAKTKLYNIESFTAPILEPKKEIIVSAERYLNITEGINADNIERVEFRIPKIGRPDFGSFRVVFKTPQLMEP